METAHDDRYVVYVRSRRHHPDIPEEAETPLISCPSYEEARRIKQQWHRAGRDCVIRYVGTSGGGD
jgi:hypothetical protein